MRLVFSSLLMCIIPQIFAQHLDHILSKETNLQAIINQASNYFDQRIVHLPPGKFVDNERMRFERKLHYWKKRVNPDGSLPDMAKKFNIYQSLQNVQQNKNRSQQWRNISQITSTGGYNGMGRLLAVAFHPTDSNIIYVGADIGGIWRSTNGGQQWTPLGDQLPFCAVGNIAVDAVDPNTIYITVGQNEGWWQYGLGVYKSIDGGASWQATAQVSAYTNAVVYHKLLIAPNNHNVLYSAQSNGFWKSTDAGVTWTNIHPGNTEDVEFKPNNPDILYISKKNTPNEIFVSTDAGASWSQLSSFGFTGNTFMELAVTPADPNYIGVGTDDGTNKMFYLSTNGGQSFSLKNASIDDPAVVHFSYLNKQKVYCGYVSNFRSIDAGSSWTKITNWYNDGVLPEVHADNHFAAINPLQPNYIYYCNDGGLYRYNEITNQWKDLSNGLIITQFYKIASSTTDSTFMIGGTQDNGGRKRVGVNSWAATNGGDAMEVAVHPQNDQTIYTTYVNGQLYRSYDQWDADTYHDISPNSNGGAWVAPYLLDYNQPNRIVMAYEDVWLSDDEGDNWTTISNNLTGNANNKLDVLDIARSNSQVIYTGRANKIYYTNNLGNTWATKTVPGNSNYFTEISQVLVHPTNENTIYVTKVGYLNNQKVYKSTNNGTNFTNISYNLPNVPVSCIIIDVLSDSTNVDMYIGTDVGVFFKKDQDTIWTYFGSGLPNTDINDLEIFYATGKLRAATYGRGIFETDIVRPIYPASTSELTQNSLHASLQQNPVSDQLHILLTSAIASPVSYSIYAINGERVYQQTQDTHSGVQQIKLPLHIQQTGQYVLEITQRNQRITIPFIKQ